jgi:S-adenosylmethionine uptake transporter
MTRNPAFWPFMAALLAVAVLTMMDGFIKSASLAVGAYSALVFRAALAFAMTGAIWATQNPRWPDRATMRVHLWRGVVGTFTALTFFSALVHLPMAEAIALSFISPLMALALAAVVLKEKIGRKAIVAAGLGMAGVLVIISGKIGREPLSQDAMLGLLLLLISAILYAWNLILQRQQAQMAGPLEITTFQSALMVLILLPAAPWFLTMPQSTTVWGAVFVSALMGMIGLLLFAWAYARAEAQVLVPVEYSGFAWAALTGFLMFGEDVQLVTLAGAVLIVAGCWIGAPRKHSEQVVTGAPGVEGGD